METSEMVLRDLEQDALLQPAPLGRRFANLIIDTFVFYFFLLAVGAAIGFSALASGDSETVTSMADNVLFTYALSYGLYLACYALAEGLLKGRTIGKLVTGTVAVKLDGSTITFKDAFLRSLCRLVPFEAFSAFGSAPWHDKWTQTMVVKKIK